MGEQRAHGREELTRQAHAALEHAESLRPGDAQTSYSVIARLWHYPSFAVQHSWTLYVPHASAPPSTFLVRWCVWDAPHDLARLTDPMMGPRHGTHATPTLSVQDASVSDAQIQVLLEELTEMTVSHFGFKGVIGLDGESFGFEARTGLACARLEWWGEGPCEWQEFTRCVARLRHALARCWMGSRMLIAYTATGAR